MTRLLPPLPGASDAMQVEELENDLTASCERHDGNQEEADSWRDVLREEHQQLRIDQLRQLKEHASAVERMLQQQQAFLQRAIKAPMLPPNIGTSRSPSPGSSRKQSLITKPDNAGLGAGCLARKRSNGNSTEHFDDVLGVPSRGSDADIQDLTTDSALDPIYPPAPDRPSFDNSKLTVTSLLSVGQKLQVGQNSFNARKSCPIMEDPVVFEDNGKQRHTWCVQDAEAALTLQVPPHDPQYESTDSSTEKVSPDKDLISESESSADGRCPVDSRESLKSMGSLNSMDTYAQAEMERAEWTNHIKTSISKQMQISHKKSTLWLVDINEKSRVAEFVERREFSIVCAVIIVLNALFVGVDTDISMRTVLHDPSEEESVVFKTVHRCFNFFFLVELILRVYAYKMKFFLGPDFKWNYFDLVLVLISVVEEILPIFDFASLRVLRGVRMVRVLRLMRVMRFFSELRLMVYSIAQSFFAVTWALSVLLVLMYLFGIVVMQGVTLHLRHEDQRPDAAIRVVASARYNSMFQTLLTLLHCITSGLDWSEAARPLGEVSWIYELLFGFYITFVVIGVLNVLTGIFVERASELHGLDRDLVIQSELRRNESFFSEMKKIFEEADIDGSNTISWEEFRDYLKNKEVRAYLATQQLDAYDARQLFNILDLEDGQEIGIEEFIMGCARLRGLAKSVDVVALLRETRQFHAKVRTFMKVAEDQLDLIRHRTEGDMIYQPSPARGSRRPSFAVSWAKSATNPRLT